MRIKIATEKKYEQQTKGFTHTEIGIGYIYFIERYISFCINCHQNEIQELRPLLDYISTNMSDYFDKTTIYSIPEKYKYMSEIIKEGITYYDRYNSFEYQFYFLRNDTQEMNKKIENKMQERCQKYSRDTSQ